MGELMNKILRKTTTAIALLASLIALPTMADQEQMDKKALADKAAKELANPNTALASLNFKFQYYGGYEDGGSSSTVLFQPQCHSR
ncbi:hypothetical protein JCM19241_123 [Vibrio ishigakensis]|uniref:Uncharacterized protein n=1 Tax=Vibrio ishigakensis TaxID=1481914 RepID=A0A0B8Q831_9VIBR|nr:hypothetical protein JCM19241_123 [Vibrio ishigakensis]